MCSVAILFKVENAYPKQYLKPLLFPNFNHSYIQNITYDLLSVSYYWPGFDK